MDRRGFLRFGSLGFASLSLPTLARAQAEASASLLAAQDKPLRSIGFGSCSQAWRSQLHWQYVARDQPDLWIWLGDIIYADHASPEARLAEFNSLKFNPLYERFRTQTPVIGTWDDHDYAYNNADGSYDLKEQSKEVLLSFLDVPGDAPVWGHQGVYQSYIFGPKGQQTHVILLDLRFNQDRNRVHKQLLGEAQWRWLENEIRSSTADLIVIGSSLAVTSPVAILGFEGWRFFADEQQRLYALLSENTIPNILLSGDRHFAEMYKVQLPSGKCIYEFMSSGMTHAAALKLPHPGRLTEMVGQKNYGMLKIDWTGTGPVVQMQIRGSEVYLSHQESIATF